MLLAMPQSKAEGFKNLRLDTGFFRRMMRPDAAVTGEFEDFDVYLMEKNVLPLLLQGLDALMRHVDKITGPGSSDSARVRFNPLVWLAQYLLRNHPRYVKDHRSSMYANFVEQAAIERGRRCLLRRRPQIEEEFRSIVREKGGDGVAIEDVPAFMRRLDAKWGLEGAFLLNWPNEFSSIIQYPEGDTTLMFPDFWVWFEEYIKTHDLMRSTAFNDAAKRKRAQEEEAKKTQEDSVRQQQALREALEQRMYYEQLFETITSEMYLNNEISRILNKGAVIQGVEEKEGGPPLQGEHVKLLRAMLACWGCQPGSCTHEDVWNEDMLATWQQWCQQRGLGTGPRVDSAGMRYLMDKDAFSEYLHEAYPVKQEGDEADIDQQTVQVMGFVEDEIDMVVEAVDEDTGEVTRCVLPESQVEEVQRRLAASSVGPYGVIQPLLAVVDRVSNRVISLLPTAS